MNTKPFYKTFHIKYDVNILLDIVEKNQDKFYCPFTEGDHYIQVYQNQNCVVKYLDLQDCNYENGIKGNETYIRYLSKTNPDKRELIKQNYDRFVTQTNELNYSIDNGIGDEVLRELRRMFGHICRGRILKLESGDSLPMHRDETEKNHTRISFPIISHKDIKNVFVVNKEEVNYHFPANGSFYCFNDSTVMHSVENKSPITRYALLFTCTEVEDFKAKDREWYQYLQWVEFQKRL